MTFAQFIAAVQAVLGEENVVVHPDDLLVFEYDGSIDRGMPSAVVFPANTSDVSRVMALAYEAGIPVVGRGSGTGLSGGAISPPGGVQIAFTRMQEVLEVDTENRHAVVEPGVVNLDLDTHVRKFGFRYAPDPSSQRACSLGGNIAENAGGPTAWPTAPPPTTCWAWRLYWRTARWSTWAAWPGRLPATT